jgi:hypothetical protein
MGAAAAYVQKCTLKYARNLLIALQLFGHETEANRFREESRRFDLHWRGRVHDWRDDLRALR